MNTKPDWNGLKHADKLKILRETAVDQIVADYKAGDLDDSMFRARLAREISLWKPHEAEAVGKQAGVPRTKKWYSEPGAIWTGQRPFFN